MPLQTVFQNLLSSSSCGNPKRRLRRGAVRSTWRRAVVAPLIAVSAVTLMTFAALAIDIGYTCTTASELQNTCDAAALAGATDLHLGTAQAITRATEYAGLNPVAAESIVAGLGITIGYWESFTRTFTPDDGSQTVSPNAVQIDGTRPNLGFFFGPVIGSHSIDITRQAIAVEGAEGCSGIWGLTDVVVAGNLVTDSFVSADGPYGGSNVLPNGDVCSCQDLRFNGSIEIHGDAMWGEGYILEANGSPNSVWGTKDEIECSAPTITADFTAAAATNDNATIGLTVQGQDPFAGGLWDLKLNSDDILILPPGDYYFTSVEIISQASLVITGPTNIYMGGQAHFGGKGFTNTSQITANLTLYSDGFPIHINGDHGFYGAILAPNSDVTLNGGSDFYGTIIGNTLALQGNANIHVDETLVEDLFGEVVTRSILVK